MAPTPSKRMRFARPPHVGPFPVATSVDLWPGSAGTRRRKAEKNSPRSPARAFGRPPEDPGVKPGALTKRRNPQLSPGADTRASVNVRCDRDRSDALNRHGNLGRPATPPADRTAGAASQQDQTFNTSRLMVTRPLLQGVIHHTFPIESKSV